MYRKNVAGQFVCAQFLLTATGAPATGIAASLNTAGNTRRCLDGTFANAGGTWTEDGTSGSYKFALAQADTNANNVSIIATGTGAIPVCVNFTTTACDPTTATNFGITALPAVASGSAGAVIISGTGTAALSVSSGLVTLAGVTHTGAVIPTVTTVTNQLTAAAIATGIWTDTTAGDFTTALSVGKSVMNGVTLGTGLTVNTVTNQLTAAQIATGVWQDTTAGDFTTALSVGKSVMNGVSLGTGLTVAAVSGAVGSVTGAVGSVTGNVGGSVASLTTNNDKTGYALTSGERNSVADAMLDRDMSTGADNGSTTVRTVRQALRFLRNKWAIAAGTLTVYKEDDSTSSWTSAISTDAGAVPIVGTDPAGP